MIDHCDHGTPLEEDCMQCREILATQYEYVPRKRIGPFPVLGAALVLGGVFMGWLLCHLLK